MAPLQPLLHVAISFLLLSSTAAKKATEISSDTRRTYTGPLTTTFTPPSSCMDIRTSASSGRYPSLEVGCQGPAGDECCPKGWASNRYFSPGVCPSGYQACTLPTTRQREETTNLNFDCPTVVDYAECSSLLNTPVETEYAYKTETFSATIRSVIATPIQIRFKATDSSVVPIPTDSFNLPPVRKGLSTGAKVGIGVGVGVGAVAILIAVVWFIRVKGKQGQASEGGQETPQQEAMLLGSLPPQQGEERPPPYSKG
ncbi:hypothetical protein SAPIO_CDS7407 [Scedosporium apiospermum]|uniref:Mid2 domain-containing protein n=1 Tax=Pseudallescheria apiosperma TaxID=563466 RepID=A0A084G1U5_PSEDA|nr:uncharacterized protein SAPIO_CDS7407 [Scedosporium apiospermum]KEZ41307.1 hypothetical protein SAPIO_CDS7407 [Scedosporium apiospermum]